MDAAPGRKGIMQLAGILPLPSSPLDLLSPLPILYQPSELPRASLVVLLLLSRLAVTAFFPRKTRNPLFVIFVNFVDQKKVSIGPTKDTEMRSRASFFRVLSVFRGSYFVTRKIRWL
jgi:hypothetical protein